MKKARIIAIVSNRCTLLLEDGSRQIGTLMGKLRKDKAPVVGDIVEIEFLEDKVAIQRILPRVNELRRPLIANVDQAIIVMSMKEPDYSSVLLDRLIFQVCYAKIKPVICFTKMDLLNENEQHLIDEIQAYKDAGYEVYTTSQNEEPKALVEALKNRISVLTGQSGAGKSSLLNRINPDFQLQTQVISKALGRGKHTTRHCELHQVGEGWVADTPGFSSLDFNHMEIITLANVIPDFQPYLNQCRFNDCTHLHEPGCAIIEAKQQQQLNQARYEHYVDIANMIKNRKPRY